ncbi:hypothetical protein OAU50_05215 [Planctomycetota bacterium]|nr:hypothetical protein [Planctomycetota bacterium]
MSQENVEGQKTTATTLPCGKCGAELEFKPGTTDLKCGYCGHSQHIEQGDDAAVIEYDLNDAINRYLGQVKKSVATERREVSCQDCGAKIIVPAGETTAQCDYCGGKRIIEDETLPEVLLPESLLPFQFDGAQGTEKFRTWLAGDGFWSRLWVKLFRPGALQQRANVGDLHGIYVPFWTYDSQAHSNWTAQAGYHYTVTVGSGENRRTETRTRWVWTNGQRRDAFDDWLVCASKRYYNNDLQKLMHKIEPFPTKRLVPYDPKYLTGFRGEKYTIDLKAGWGIARKGILSECRSRCSRDVPGDTQRYLEVRTTLFGQSFKHVLLPVFVMGYKFDSKQYNVLINGATGEVQGQAPISKIKLIIFIITCLILIGGIVWLVMYLNQQPPSA